VVKSPALASFKSSHAAPLLAHVRAHHERSGNLHMARPDRGFDIVLEQSGRHAQVPWEVDRRHEEVADHEIDASIAHSTSNRRAHRWRPVSSDGVGQP